MCKGNARRGRRYEGLYLLGVSEASPGGGISTEGELRGTSSGRVLPMGGPCTGGGRGISHRGRTNEEVLFFYIKVEWSVLCGCMWCRIVWCVACGVGWPYTSDGSLK